MLVARKKRFHVFALTVIALTALVAVTAAGCGSSVTTTVGSSAAGSIATTKTVATTSNPSGSQALMDLVGKYKQVKSMSLDFKAATPDGKVASGTIWGETGKMLKIETTENGMKSVILVNLADNTMTMYQPSTNRGTKTKALASFQNPSTYLDGIGQSKLKDLGTGTINGEVCRIIEFARTNANGSTTNKMWLSERLGFPVQITSTTADGKTTTIDYTNIKVGALPGDTFQVPASVKITTVPS
jgi:outer membrane lipoprotein-sorting protein